LYERIYRKLYPRLQPLYEEMSALIGPGTIQLPVDKG
jgi:hypothetical protein